MKSQLEDTKDYLERIINYNDTTNMYHPDRVDENQDTSFIKLMYRSMYKSLDFQVKNIAANYLPAIKSTETLVKGLKKSNKELELNLLWEQRTWE